MKMIKLSIYITTQNRPFLLERALRSLAWQSENDFEVIICDDCSNKDNQKRNIAIIEKFYQSFVKISYLFNDKIEGACYSRNRAISTAIGKYITGLDDDDVFHADRVKIFLDFIQTCHNFSFLCTRTCKLTEVNIRKIKTNHGNRAVKITWRDIKQFNAVGNQIFIETVKLRDIGGFDIAMPAWQDYDMWFRLIKEFGPAVKLGCCTMFLDLNESRTRITTSSQSYQGYRYFLKKHGDLLTKSEKLSLFYMDKLNRKQKINLFSILLTKDKILIFRVFKYYLTYRFPYLFSLYERFIK